MMKRIFFVLLPLIMLACSDDEQFTTNRSDLLTMPAEGIRLDTVFSHVSSSTYSFWLYNDNSEALRIATARLSDGTKGFRVNVDGEFANPVVSDVEVLGGDSLLVFVELTPETTGQLEPQELTDELLLTLESGAEQRVPLKGWAWDAEVWTDVTITSDTDITTRQPILVYGTLTVAEGAVLTLTGTQLYFHDQANIVVNGTLRADGALLRGDRLDYMFSYLPYDRISGQWRGVSVGENAVCELNATEIRNARHAVECAAGASLTMNRCVVHNSEGSGVVSTDAMLTLNYCQVSNAGGDLVSVHGGTAVLDHCTLAQYYPFSADRGLCLSFDEQSQVTGTHLLFAAYGDVLAEDVEWESEHDWSSPDGNIQLTSFMKAEKEDFLTIDEDNLYYDFHLSETSEITDAGCY